MTDEQLQHAYAEPDPSPVVVVGGLALVLALGAGLIFGTAYLAHLGWLLAY